MDDNEIQDMLRQNMKFNIYIYSGTTWKRRKKRKKLPKKKRKRKKNAQKLQKNPKKKLKRKCNSKKIRKSVFTTKIGIKLILVKLKLIVDVGNNPAYSLYNIELEKTEDKDDEEWALQENIKGKYITAIDETDEQDRRF